MSKDIHRERNGHELIKHCIQRGARVRQGKGDHVVVYAPDGQSIQVIPDRKLASGLAAKIVKWMISVGLVMFTLVLCLYEFAPTVFWTTIGNCLWPI